MLARALLDRADRAFLAAVADAGSAMIRVDDLSRQIEKVDATVRPSFVRSGLEQAADLPASSSTTQALQVPLLQTGDQFNFVAYTHFKAYLDLLIDRKINFPKFRRDFEKKIGQDVLELLALGSPGTSAATNSGPSTARQRRDALQQTLDQIDRLCQILVDRGLVAQIDTGNPFKNVPEEVIDWSEDLLDLSWSIALDGDITLGSQLLLQEQGLRLYPSFARCAIQTLLNDIPGQQVSVDEYYMDTDYNSDPDRFQVKEVLLNIVLESM